MFTVIRSYNNGIDSDIGGLTELIQAFKDGWSFIRASEYVPCDINKNGNFVRYGYIEYILFREDSYTADEKY